MGGKGGERTGGSRSRESNSEGEDCVFVRISVQSVLFARGGRVALVGGR